MDSRRRSGPFFREGLAGATDREEILETFSPRSSKFAIEPTKSLLSFEKLPDNTYVEESGRLDELEQLGAEHLAAGRMFSIFYNHIVTSVLVDISLPQFTRESLQQWVMLWLLR